MPDEIDKWRPRVSRGLKEQSRDDGLTDADIKALSECIRLHRQHDNCVDKMFAEHCPWIEIAMHCCYGMQNRNLRLKPWQSPPLHAGEDDPLWTRMQKLRISRFSADPLRDMMRWSKQHRSKQRRRS
jgi:hypothetical protein